MGCSSQALHAVYRKHVRPYALNTRPHPDQHAAKLLDIRFACRIVYGSDTFCKDCRHKDIGGSRHRCLIQKHIPAFQMSAFRNMQIEGLSICIIFLGSSEIHESQNMSIDSPSTNLVSPRFREICPSETGEKRSYNHYGTSQRGYLADKVGTCYVIFIDFICHKRIGSLIHSLHLDTHAFKYQYQILDIKYFRYIGYYDLLLCQEHCTNHLQRLILGTLRTDRAAQLMTSLYYE